MNHDEFIQQYRDAFDATLVSYEIMEFYCTKVDGVLIGIDEENQEIIKELGLDTIVKCKTNKKRNYENLKRFFKFVSVAFDMQSFFEDKEVFRKWLIMGAGYFKTVTTPKGATIFLPESIAFENLEEEEFKKLFKKCLNYYLTQLTKHRSVSDQEFMRILDFD